jgi:hypothetical protein
MRAKIQNLGKISIDSLKIRLPIDQIQIIDEGVKSKWILVNEKTGDIDETYFKENSFKVSNNGISVRYGIEHQQTSKQKIQQFLIILLPSKILCNRYFEGFTSDNINTVYNTLISHKVVEFSLKSFLNAECTDVDFKQDSILDAKTYQSSISKIKELAKPSKKKSQGYLHFNKADNKGIEFSDRRTTSYQSNPYFKIYHKEVELTNNSEIFARNYLEQIDFADLVRFECTIKNKKHFRYLGIEDTRLQNLLELTPEIKKTIMSSIIKKHLEPRTNTQKEVEGLKITEQMHYNNIVALMNVGNTFDTIRDVITLHGIKDKNARYRKRNELNYIYDNFIKDTLLDKTTKKVDEFLSFIGWG